MIMDLSGKVALVTGGAERAGRVFSLALAKAGADVVVNHWKTKEAAETIKTEIEKLGRRCLVIESDVSEVKQNQEMITKIEQVFGRLDILIHNASNFNTLPFSEVTEEMWDSSFDLILRGPFFLSQAAAKLMKKNGYGRIIGLSGNSYYEANPDFIPHILAKGALARLMELLAVSLSPEIQSFAVCPAAFLLTEVQGKFTTISKMAKRDEKFTQDKKHIIEKGITIHAGDPDEVAELIIFLAGCSNYMNGAVIPIDGGKHII